MLSVCLPLPSSPPSPPFRPSFSSCLLTSLPSPGGEVHPPHEAPWDGADGGGRGRPIPHCLARLGEVAGPCVVPKPQLCSSRTMGFIPWASCLLPAQLPFLPLPWSLVLLLSLEMACGVALRGAQPPHCWAWQTLPSWQGSWTDMPYAALQGQSGKGPFALAGLCLHPSSPQPSPPPPLPWPWLQLIYQLWSQPHLAPQGVIWLLLVSERIILSVDCPFL